MKSHAKKAGDRCANYARCERRLILVNGALVCPVCDAVADWPTVKRGEAEVSDG